jgi:UDP-glucose 4-epimerase
MDYAKNGCFNVGTGKETDINAIFDLVANATGSKQKRINGPAMPGEQRRSCITWDLIRRELGWSPVVDIQEGIRKTVDYFKSRSKVKV